MASGKFLILRRPRSGRLEGREALIQRKSGFLPSLGACPEREPADMKGRMNPKDA